MKKNPVIYLAVVMVVFGFVVTGYAQFGDLINRTREEVRKSRDKDKRLENQSPQNQLPSSASTPVNNSAGTPSANKERYSQKNALGTIYFSNKPFTTGTEGSKTSFNSNEFIYGRLVLNGGTVRDVLKPSSLTGKVKNQIPFKLYRRDHSNRNQKEDLYFLADNAVLSESVLDQTYWDFDVFPEPGKARTVVFTDSNVNNGYSASDSLYLFLSNNDTKEGTYRIGVEIKTAGVDFRGNPLPESQRQMIEGEVSLTFRGSDYAAIQSNYNALTKTFAATAKQNQAAGQELPPEWSQQSGRILPISTAAQLQLMYLNKRQGSNNLKVIKLHATAPGQTSWSIEKNNLGIPLYRFSNQTYTVFIRNQRANQCFFDSFGLRQNYSGGGTYGQTFLDFDEGSQKFFNCDKMK